MTTVRSRCLFKQAASEHHLDPGYRLFIKDVTVLVFVALVMNLIRVSVCSYQTGSRTSEAALKAGSKEARTSAQ